MAFTGELLEIGPQGSYNKEWMYVSTSDSFGSASTDGYFNSVTSVLKRNDTILIIGNDNKPNKMYVTSASGASTVTIAPMNAYVMQSGVPGANYSIVVLTDGSATNNQDILVDVKLMITEVIVTLRGAGTASDTIQVQTASGAANVTNAVDISSGADNAVIGAGTIDHANATFDVGDTVRIRQVDGGSSDCPICQVELRGVLML